MLREIAKEQASKKHRELPEFKFNNSSPEIKRRILSCIGSGEVDICYCILRKDDVRHHLRTRQQIVYNYLTGLLISNIVLEYSPDDGIQITVDKSLNGIQREAFDQYVVFKTMERNMVSDPLPPIQIVHADSVREPCIQAVDFVAGALHYYYRENDDTYSRIVDPKIRLALDFFKGRQKR